WGPSRRCPRLCVDRCECVPAVSGVRQVLRLCGGGGFFADFPPWVHAEIGGCTLTVLIALSRPRTHAGDSERIVDNPAGPPEHCRDRRRGSTHDSMHESVG